MTTNSLILLNSIVDNGYCVGCGACGYLLDIPMRLNQYGEFIPELSALTKSGKTISYQDKLETVCPFLSPELNETVLAAPLFSDHCSFDDRIGFNIKSYAGYVNEGEFRDNGTSGGMGTWIGSELLRLGHIDAVIHVKESDRETDQKIFFKYDISRTPSEIGDGAKTRYHVVELSNVLRMVRDNPGKYLIVGVPCVCKSIRRLQLLDPVLQERIAFVVSLVCGHFKSVNWTKSLAWGAGIHPDDLKGFQYRTKGPDIPARAYVFRAKYGDSNESVLQKNSAEVTGGKFNAGAMMLKACDYCDDIVGETSDLTIGDAWIPRFEVDTNGTNLLIVRNDILHKVIQDASSEQRIIVNEISAKEAGDSQSGGFRQRREGLSYRLKVSTDPDVPVKRVKAGQYKLSFSRKIIYKKRMDVARKSREKFREALEMNDYTIYQTCMRTEFKKLRVIELSNSLFRSIISRVKRYYFSFIK